MRLEWKMHAGFRTCIVFPDMQLDNSKQARNLHVVFHDVKIMVKKHGLSNLPFKNKLN